MGRDGSFEEVQDARNYLYDVSPSSWYFFKAQHYNELIAA